MNKASPIPAAAHGAAHAPGHGPDLGPFDWSDPLRLEDSLTEDERMLRDAARAFAEDRLAPRVTDAYRSGILTKACQGSSGTRPAGRRPACRPCRGRSD